MIPPTNFGSYKAEDVTWLLKDLSSVQLEQSVEARESIIQNGGHYSEMLPVEFQPDAAYTNLFKESLIESAPRLAQAVAVVGELLLLEHAKTNTVPVLVSLARAGVPVGILLKKYYQTRGVETSHYAISIVRGKGIDVNAIDYILARHSGESIRFIDGWTGKGAITKEMKEAFNHLSQKDEKYRSIDPEIAVLADPASCTTLYGTRDDFLIPSACLNSTVSGLVSRTVLREDLIGPNDFHGAKFYQELKDADVSEFFLEEVAKHFAVVSANAAKEALALFRGDRTPAWLGWEVVEHLGRVHGISNMHLIKPGVGETTRVLLRRVPWKILIRPDRAADVQHVVMLAKSRNVPVEIDPDLPYSCVGLIEDQQGVDHG